MDKEAFMKEKMAKDMPIRRYSNCMHYCFSQLLGINRPESSNWGIACQKFGMNLDLVLKKSYSESTCEKLAGIDPDARVELALAAFGRNKGIKGSVYGITRLLLGQEVGMNVAPWNAPPANTMVGVVGITEAGDTHFFVVNTANMQGEGISGSGDIVVRAARHIGEDLWEQDGLIEDQPAKLRCLCYFWPA